jgi:hypothetical protein
MTRQQVFSVVEDQILTFFVHRQISLLMKQDFEKMEDELTYDRFPFLIEIMIRVEEKFSYGNNIRKNIQSVPVYYHHLKIVRTSIASYHNVEEHSSIFFFLLI